MQIYKLTTAKGIFSKVVSDVQKEVRTATRLDFWLSVLIGCQGVLVRNCALYWALNSVLYRDLSSILYFWTKSTEKIRLFIFIKIISNLIECRLEGYVAFMSKGPPASWSTGLHSPLKCRIPCSYPKGPVANSPLCPY